MHARAGFWFQFVISLDDKTAKNARITPAVEKIYKAVRTLVRIATGNESTPVAKIVAKLTPTPIKTVSMATLSICSLSGGK